MKKITDKMRMDWMQKKVAKLVMSDICLSSQDLHCHCDETSLRRCIDAAIRAEGKKP